MTETETDQPLREAVSTFRPVSSGMEEHFNVYHKVLDHGFIAVKDYMGDDLSILQMARMSYGKGTKGTNDDRALLRYLMRHQHTSPFEGCVIKLHVKLPIFVMRQWVRHRTASLNEYSARYSIMPDEFYMPEASQLAVQSTDNKRRTFWLCCVRMPSTAFPPIIVCSMRMKMARPLIPMGLALPASWRASVCPCPPIPRCTGRPTCTI